MNKESRNAGNDRKMSFPAFLIELAEQNAQIWTGSPFSRRNRTEISRHFACLAGTNMIEILFEKAR